MLVQLQSHVSNMIVVDYGGAGMFMAWIFVPDQLPHFHWIPSMVEAVPRELPDVFWTERIHYKGGNLLPRDGREI